MPPPLQVWALILEKQQQQQADTHGDKANKPQLAVFQLHHALEGIAPGLRGQQGQNPFQHQHEA